MTFVQAILIALDMLRLHKLRAFLTMLGVIIGVMSVTIIVMISGAFNTYLANQFAQIGSDTIFVIFDPSRLPRGTTVGEFDSLTVEDIQFIKDRTGKVSLASGFREGGRRVVRVGETEVENVSVRAVDASFLELNRVPLVSGRQINEADDQAKANVALVSDKLAAELFPRGDALGSFVQLPGITLQIVGVTKPLELFGERDGKNMLMPLSTANSKWLGGERLDLILMRAAPGIDPNDAMDEIWEALMIKTGNRPIFQVESSENVLRVFQGIIGGAGAILAAIAALSLLVGGIGIMNIMLVSVTERTREIGLRKSVGARSGAILMQFLVEAATLSLVGGLIGMGVAYGIGLAGSALTRNLSFPAEGGLSAVFPLPAALGAMAFSAMIGMVFGLYPAISASRLDPIEALRHE